MKHKLKPHPVPQPYPEYLKKEKVLKLKANDLEFLTSAHRDSYFKTLVNQTHLLYLFQWRAQIQYPLK